RRFQHRAVRDGRQPVQRRRHVRAGAWRRRGPPDSHRRLPGAQPRQGGGHRRQQGRGAGDRSRRRRRLARAPAQHVAHGALLMINNKNSLRHARMNSIFSRLGLSLLATLLATHALAHTLQRLDVARIPSDRVELMHAFDQPVAAPRGYTIDQPARIALDLPGVTSAIGVRNRELGKGNARSLNIMQVKDRTRLVVNLDRLTPYSTRTEGNLLYVVLGEPASAPAAAPLVAATPTPNAAVASAGGRVIRAVDFQRGEK